tara:strand:- start:382 stop:1500 length:1119 start_codon:yes stop_codon:yes gene_type:complete
MKNLKKIPISNIKLKKTDINYLKECIESGWVSSQGKFVNKFEKMFAKFCGTKFAISTSNGTSALHLALLALGIKPGDEVIVPSFTFISTANAVKYTGAKPVFIDSDPESWNISPSSIEAAINTKTKAIIIVHIYGHPADMETILKVSQKYRIPIVEDAAEAHGAEYDGKTVGSFGELATFSFYGNKIITTGEGGIITTNSKMHMEKITQLRDHGMSRTRKYWHTKLGYNYRLTNIQAALGVSQMERVDDIIKKKIEIASLYEKNLKDIAGIQLPPNQKNVKNVFWLYNITITKDFPISKDQLIHELKQNGIDTRPLFPPLHTQPIYSTGQKLPVCEQLYQNGFSLPSYTSLKDSDILKITTIIKNISNHRRT